MSPATWTYLEALGWLTSQSGTVTRDTAPNGGLRIRIHVGKILNETTLGPSAKVTESQIERVIAEVAMHVRDKRLEQATIRFSSEVEEACQRFPLLPAEIRPFVLRALLDYASAWLPLAARPLADGNPPQSGIEVYRANGWMYAISLEHTGFLLYQLGADGRPKQIGPPGFRLLETREVPEGLVAEIFETAAGNLDSSLSEVAERLKSSAKKLREKQRRENLPDL